jgi:hypothetical protein
MRVALQNPAYCSACFGARPGEKHIDFEAAYDGPVINSDAGIKVAIDDLVICEKCLIAAASLIGLTNADELRAENEELGQSVEELSEQVSKRDNIIRDMESTQRNLMDEKIQKKIGRPKRRPPVAVNGTH